MTFGNIMSDLIVLINLRKKCDLNLTFSNILSYLTFGNIESESFLLDLRIYKNVCLLVRLSAFTTF